MSKYKSQYIKLLLATGSLSIFLTGCSPNTATLSDNSFTEEIVSENEKTNSQSENTNADKETEAEASEVNEIVETTSEPVTQEHDELQDKLTDTQQNSINMLNYLTVLTQEINSSKNSKLYLEQAYSSIVNNTYPNAIDDRTLGELNALLDTLEDYRMVAVKRERLEYIYEQNQAQALRDAVPNPLGLLSTVQSFNLAKLVTSVSYMAVDSITSYQTSSAQADLQYLQDGWALDDKEENILHNQCKNTFNYMVKTVNENQLPGELALTEDAVDTFVEWKNNDNVISRLRFLETNQDTYAAFGGYWLTLAESYYENGDYQKCLDAINTYEDLGICIFRKNYDYAEVLPLAIVSAEDALENKEYIAVAERYAENILNNTENDQWSLRYFAAQTYVDLYAQSNDKKYLEKAYNIALDNVNTLITKQQSLNDTFLTEISEVKVEKGASSAEKDEIKKYNKMLKEERKTELPPVYEPLMLNCDLLFSLVEELDILPGQKNEIEEIMHQNDQSLFLTEELDNLYKFSSNNIDEETINIFFDGDELSIPAKYVSESTVITVTIKRKDTTETINDWTLKKVTRKKEKEIDSFKAVYTSEAAKNFKYGNNMKIYIEINAKPDSDIQKLNFEYKVISKERWSVIPDKITYQRITE